MAQFSAQLTPKVVADQVGCSPDTIRRYSERFARHLSDGANPGKGGTRYFSPVDVFVLQTIKRETERGIGADDIDGLLDTLAVPEGLLDQGEEVEEALSVGGVASTELTALVRQVTTTLASLETNSQRVDRVVDDVAGLKAALVELRAQVEQPAPRRATIPPEYLVLSVALLALSAMTIAALFLSK